MKLSLGILVSIFSSLSLFAVSFGDYDIEFDETDVFASIDEISDTISITTSTNVDENPNVDFTVNLEFLDHSCTQKVLYSSLALRSSCTFDIDIEDLEKIHKVNYTVYNESNEVISENFLELRLIGYDTTFSWENIEKTADYNSEASELTLGGKICHDIAPIYDNYYINLGFKDESQPRDSIYYEGNKFKWRAKAVLHHVPDTDCLEFTAIIKDSFSKNYQKLYSARIFSSTGDLEWNDDMLFPGEDVIEDDINWIVRGDYAYDYYGDSVKVKIFVPELGLEPSDQYTIKIDNGDDVELIYDIDQRYLYTEYEIYHNKLKEDRDYEIEYIIRGSDYQRVKEGSMKIRFNYNKSDFDTLSVKEQVQDQEISQEDIIEENESDIESSNTQESSQSESSELSPIEKAIDTFITRQRVKFPNSEDLKENLIKTTELLQNYAKVQPKYQKIIDEINEVIISRVSDM
ncbi:hypothetical protein N9J72_01800 [Candidatus Gracilibacteria bacterium]|nr:hypothetical protein [Candidatus Gracilibacteria bacterium]